MTQWGLDTLFNPSKRHMDEEKRRLQTTREQIGDSSGGRRIDFESGKVTIRREAASSTAEPATDEAEPVTQAERVTDETEPATDEAPAAEAEEAHAAPDGRPENDPQDMAEPR